MAWQHHLSRIIYYRATTASSKSGQERNYRNCEPETNVVHRDPGRGWLRDPRDPRGKPWRNRLGRIVNDSKCSIIVNKMFRGDHCHVEEKENLRICWLLFIRGSCWIYHFNSTRGSTNVLHLKIKTIISFSYIYLKKLDLLTRLIYFFYKDDGCLGFYVIFMKYLGKL